MVALNQVLQKAGQEMGLCRVKNSSSGAMSALFIKKANARSIILWLSNIFIWVAKTVDKVIIWVAILKYQQYLEVYEMSIKKYLGEERIRLSKRKAEFSIKYNSNLFLDDVLTKSGLGNNKK